MTYENNINTLEGSHTELIFGGRGTLSTVPSNHSIRFRQIIPHGLGEVVGAFGFSGSEVRS
jgi:hypothetical protein